MRRPAFSPHRSGGDHAALVRRGMPDRAQRAFSRRPLFRLRGLHRTWRDHGGSRGPGVEGRSLLENHVRPLSRLPALALSLLADAAMLGQSRAEGFRIDAREIEEARWMTKEEARARLADRIDDGIKMPTAIAIARLLITDWVQGS